MNLFTQQARSNFSAVCFHLEIFFSLIADALKMLHIWFRSLVYANLAKSELHRVNFSTADCSGKINKRFSCCSKSNFEDLPRGKLAGISWATANFYQLFTFASFFSKSSLFNMHKFLQVHEFLLQRCTWKFQKHKSVTLLHVIILWET